jgi:signal transduction histidine kinase/ligand-binding sensor domain-containing protein
VGSIPITRSNLICMFTALALLAIAPDAAAERTFRKLGEGRGLDANVATSMLVDRNGLLWVASREGLFLYDGYVATPFRSDPDRPGSISDVDVRSLYEAQDGALWVSTNTGGLNRRDPVTGEFKQFHHDSANPRSLSSESVYGVAEDAHGNLWVGTQNGLNRLDANGRDFTRFFHERGQSASLAGNWVFPIHLGPSKRLWIGTVGGGVDRWNETTRSFEHFPLSRLVNGVPEYDFTYALHEAADGRVWVGTRMGLVVLDPERNTASRVDLATVRKDENPLVTAIYPDRKGRLWIATIEHGVLILDPATGRSMRPHGGALGEPGGLPDSEYLSFAGTDNTIFVGSWGSGVYSAPLEEPQFWLLTPTATGTGLQTENVTAVLGDASAGKPWVGSFGGGAIRVDVLSASSTPPVRDPEDSLSGAGILSMAAGGDGSYFGGSTDGLYRFAADGSSLGHEKFSEDRKDGIGAGYVVALLPDATGLWVGTGGSGLYRRDLGADRYRGFRHDPKVANSLSGDFITALAPGRAGRLWVGTRSDGLNLCVIEPWSCERFDGRTPGERNLANYHVTALHRDGGGALWVATDGGGVHRVNEDAQGRVVSIDRWDVARGLLDDGIMAVESDDDRSLWLSTRRGISRLDPATGRVVNYVRESGLPVVHFNTGASSADYRWIYFGSVDGLLSIPRGSEMPSRSPSSLRVTRIQSLTKGTEQPMPRAQLTGGFETRFGDGLAIEFAVLDYSETPHDYSYRLKAGDAWTALGKRRQLTFFGLAPGHYRFEVRGRDAFGNWSTSPAVDFEVVPPFWRTTWFRVTAFSAIVLLALGLHLTRLRTLRRRNAVLEQLQLQREHALAQAERSQRELEEAYVGLRQLTGRLESAKEDERSHLSRELHDEFGQTLTAAKINLQMLRSVTPDAAIAQRLDESVSMIDGMISQARNIALGLRPPLLDEAGLVAALDHHLKSLAERSGVRIEFDAAGGGARIPPALNVTVFRLVQEAVNNALRHARATTIRVTLRDDADALRLVVEDDGVGFDREAVAQRAKRGEHLGLLGMTERARSAGGDIVLDSRPGGGSRIEVRIPLVREEIGS